MAISIALSESIVCIFFSSSWYTAGQLLPERFYVKWHTEYCMHEKKIKNRHYPKFLDEKKSFPQLLLPVRTSLRCFSSSGVLRARLSIEILIQLAVAYVSCARERS